MAKSKTESKRVLKSIISSRKETLKRYLSGVLPCDSGESLNGQSTECTQHCPPSVNDFALAEPLNPENLRVGLKRRRFDLCDLHPCSYHVASEVLREVLVQRVQVELQVLRGPCKSERVEPAVADHASVEPLRRIRLREPHQPIAGDGFHFHFLFLWRRRRLLGAEVEERVESSGV